MRPGVVPIYFERKIELRSHAPESLANAMRMGEGHTRLDRSKSKMVMASRKGILLLHAAARAVPAASHTTINNTYGRLSKRAASIRATPLSTNRQGEDSL